MKLGQVTKLKKKKKKKIKKKKKKKNVNDVMLAIHDLIVIFLIYSQFGAIRKPDSWCKVCKTYILIKSNLLSYKN